jgi:hypothetical protein
VAKAAEWMHFEPQYILVLWRSIYQLGIRGVGAFNIGGSLSGLRSGVLHFSLWQLHLPSTASISAKWPNCTLIRSEGNSQHL